MKVVDEVNLVEVFAAWGAHEARGRFRDNAANLDLESKFACADFALRIRAPLIAGILQLSPIGSFRVEIEPRNRDAIEFYNGQSIDDWINAAKSANGDSWTHFQRLTSGESRETGTPVVTMQDRKPLGPLIVWDGLHRVAAWRHLSGADATQRLDAFVILTAR